MKRSKEENLEILDRYRNSEKEERGKTWSDKHTQKVKSRSKFCKWF